jgi:SAM-dependent methyltransferase
MSLSKLFSDTVFARWLSGRKESHALTVSMSGIRMGEHLLVVGLGEPGLLAALGAQVGMTGHVSGIDPDPAAVEQSQAAADRAGVLVETFAAPSWHAAFPHDPNLFDNAVVWLGTRIGPAELRSIGGELLRVLRPGGRCLLVENIKAAAGRESSLALLGPSGFKGAHVLAEREGLRFVEAMKGR